jgi:hypothetical protein
VLQFEEEPVMSDRKPSEPTPADFKEASEKSVEAGIADETAAYTKASENQEGESEAHPS